MNLVVFQLLIKTQHASGGGEFQSQEAQFHMVAAVDFSHLLVSRNGEHVICRREADALISAKSVGKSAAFFAPYPKAIVDASHAVEMARSTWPWFPVNCVLALKDQRIFADRDKSVLTVSDTAKPSGVIPTPRPIHSVTATVYGTFVHLHNKSSMVFADAGEENRVGVQCATDCERLDNLRDWLNSFVLLSSFRKTAIAVILALSIGAQWPLLQSVAWLNMLVTFSATDGFQRAVVKTFDGKHLCRICKLVRAGQQAEKDAPVKDAVKKLDPMLASKAEFRFEPFPFPHNPQPLLQCVVRPFPPPGEPPDLA